MRSSFASVLVATATVVALVSAGGRASAQVNAGVNLAHDGAHDMDFAIGRWRTDVTMIKDPFNRPNESVHMSGTKVARPVWGGKAVLEEIVADGPAGHWEALNLFLYDPVAHEWSQNYADSATGRMEGPAGVGSLRDGKLVFYWQDKVGGRTMLLRGTWKDFTPDSHTYEVARSIDGGSSWHTSFTAHVTRVPEH